MSEVMTERDLINKSFTYINAYKRNRALAQISRLEGNRDKANYHELKQYQFIDSLELALRALQKGMRAIEELEEEANDTV